MRRRQLFPLLALFSSFALISACGDDNDAFPATPTPAPTNTNTPRVVGTPTHTPAATPTTPVGPPHTPTPTGTPGGTTFTPTHTFGVDTASPTVTPTPGIRFQCKFSTAYRCRGGPNDGQVCRPYQDDPGCAGSPCVDTNFFCKGGDLDGQPCPMPIPTHGAPCPPFSPTPGGGRCLNSEIQICNVSNCPAVSTVVSGGSIRGSCSADGSQCTAVLEFFDPVFVSGIGFVCVEAISPSVLTCRAGRLNCSEEPGPGLDYDLLQDHTIGSCGDPDDPEDTTGNAECRELCRNHCAAMGREILDFNCSGYCKGGIRADQKCVCDSPSPICTGAHCADLEDPTRSGSCNGRDNLRPPGRANVCSCQCLATGGNPSRPGALNLQVAAQIIVQTAPPCGQGGVLLRLPPQCVPLTTETASGILINANNVTDPARCVIPGPSCNQIPNRGERGEKLVVTGKPVSCEQLRSQGMSGVNLVGNISFFDSTLGDLETQLDWFCE